MPMGIVINPFREVKDQLAESEGIVLLGAGGDLQQWIDGVAQVLYEEGISTTADPTELWERAFSLTTTGGRPDLVLTFKEHEEHVLDLSKMATWRLRFGDCSWISDYLTNYANQH